MKKIDSNGFAISTLIYGILIIFMILIIVFLSTLMFRYNIFKDLISKVLYYNYDINICLKSNNYESGYIAPYNATYYFYEEDNIPIKIYLEKGEEIKLTSTSLILKKNEDITLYTLKTKGKEIKIKKISSTKKITISNQPNLENKGLVPIKYIESEKKWVIASETSQWYDYENQKWANAVSLDLSTDEKKAKLLNEDGTYKVGTELTLPDGTSNDSDVLAMFVWIPRFSYTIGCTGSSTCLGYKIDGASDLAQSTPGAIDIKFVDRDTKDLLDFDNNEYPNYIYDSSDLDNRTPNNWYTHPAFWWDNNNDGIRASDGSEELSGIWVGKFETTGDAENPTILPNQESIRGQKVSQQFLTAKKFNSKEKYGILDEAHMMKNSEWDAVAYLSQSIYGKYGNLDYEGSSKEIELNGSKYTGCDSGQYIDGSWGYYKYNDVGMDYNGASTTGNVYGIYDMSGGAFEYVMGNYSNDVSLSGFPSSWLDTEPTAKYYDNYVDEYTKGWYLDSNSTSNDSRYSWLYRGGYSSSSNSTGIFAYGWEDGDSENTRNISFRVSIIGETIDGVINEENAPNLQTGLVPVKYDNINKKWIITSADDSEWYDYDNQKWANAVSLDLSTNEQKQKLLTNVNDLTSYKIGVELKLPTLTSTESDVLAMFVWVPRYSYTIGCKDSSTQCWGYKLKNDNIPDKLKNGSYYASYPGAERPGMIDVKFVTTDIKEMYEGNAPTYKYSSTGNRVAKNWYTHPAFWWDNNNNGERELDEELSGIWVGKFETSVASSSACYTSLKNKSYSNNCSATNQTVQPRIIPNVLSLVTQNISNQFYTSQKFAQNDLYRINGDTHLSKNSEWGAILYFSQSIYGKYGNNMYGKSVDGAGIEVLEKIIYKNDSGVDGISGWARYTGRSEGIVPYLEIYQEKGSYQYDGQSISDESLFCEKCGTGASSTGNIYGIYDLSGGATENVMALYPFAAEGYVEDVKDYWGYHILTNNNGEKVPANNPGFTKKPEKKYYDEYSTYNLSDKNSDNSFEYIGHATAELSADGNKLLVDRPWVVRGGNFNHGQYTLRGYYFSTGRGSRAGLTSFRTILVYADES